MNEKVVVVIAPMWYIWHLIMNVMCCNKCDNVDVLMVGILLCDLLEIIHRKFTEFILLSVGIVQWVKICCSVFGKMRCL